MRIFKKGNFWSYSIELPRFNGKRHRKYKTGFTNYNDCRNEAIIAQNLANNNFKGLNISLKDFYAKFALKYQNSAKYNSAKAFTTCFKIFSKFYNTDLQLKSITTISLQLVFDNLALIYKPTTLRQIFGFVKQLFARATRLGLLETNPILNCKLPRPKRTLPNWTLLDKFLTKQEVKKFLETAQTDKYYLIYLLAIYTGARIGELLALSWADIDFVNKTITINKNYCYTASEGFIDTTKTASSNRTIDLSQMVLNQLLPYRATGRLFNYNYWTIRRHFIRLLGTAKINKYPSLHILRHTHTSLMAEAGVPLELIQKRLGHSTDKVTRDIYLHFSKNYLKTAVEKLDIFMQN